jgi:hypothetical protein
MAEQSVDAYFADKPRSRQVFDAARATIEAAGPSTMTVRTQISFGNDRKFAWFWLYNVTKKDPNGVLHLMLAIDEPVDSSHVRNVEQISKSRWNHQIVLRTLADSESAWLRDLVERAYRYSIV